MSRLMEEGSDSPQEATDSPASPWVASPPMSSRPPLNFVVLRDDVAAGNLPTMLSSLAGSPSSLGTRSLRGRHGSPGSARASVASSAFKLQPRTAVPGTPSTISQDDTRGRKRSSGSISSSKDRLLRSSMESFTGGTASMSESPFSQSLPAGAQSPRTDSATLFLQSLSIQSPGAPVHQFAHTSPRSCEASPGKKSCCAFSPSGSLSTGSNSTKHAPLKVLSQSEPRSEKYRPPLHGTPSSFFSSIEESHTNKSLLSTPTRDANDNYQFLSPANRSGGETEEKSLGVSPRTPLPSISLTPRSAMSSASRRSVLPMFPSPEELNSPNSRGSSFEDRKPAAVDCVGASGLGLSIEHQSEDRPSEKGSFFPFPDWEESALNGESGPRPQRSQSLLDPALPRENLSFLFEQCANDNDSLSDSDDEPEFLLAPPSAIAEENENTLGNKRRAYQNRSGASPAFSDALCQSNTSLQGMEFLPSASNLYGMSLQRSWSKNYLDRVGSQTSIGLTLDSANNQASAQASYEAQLKSPGTRDLVTPPPAIEKPNTPPRLPRKHYDCITDPGEGDLFVERRGACP